MNKEKKKELKINNIANLILANRAKELGITRRDEMNNIKSFYGQGPFAHEDGTLHPFIYAQPAKIEVQTSSGTVDYKIKYRKVPCDGEDLLKDFNWLTLECGEWKDENGELIFVIPDFINGNENEIVTMNAGIVLGYELNRIRHYLTFERNGILKMPLDPELDLMIKTEGDVYIDIDFNLVIMHHYGCAMMKPGGIYSSEIARMKITLCPYQYDSKAGGYVTTFAIFDEGSVERDLSHYDSKSRSTIKKGGFAR